MVQLLAHAGTLDGFMAVLPGITTSSFYYIKDLS